MPVKLSIIIVNYNVRFFLEQCLHAVEKASTDIAAEIFVVDNHSVDGSMAMVAQKFPQVIRMENKQNLGFSKANNQAIKQSQGEYILLLNPDTVVEEDTFRKVIQFMDQTPDAGALGVKMIDGKGHFLPESKRALPTPWVSFYKVFGLAALFPKSKKFGQYHLGYLDKEKTHVVDILPGAFMLLRKTALDKAGLLDETFFMYGEDIDLSYRIVLSGYKNYYFPETAIIHYKGESTRKGSLNYVLVFYQAMMIFAKKHFSEKNARFFSLSIHAAIYFRMGLALLKRFFDKAFYPIADALISTLGFLLLNPAWEKIKFTQGGAHPDDMLRIFIPAYILIWLGSIFFAGGYDKPYSIRKFIQGLLTGTLIILAGYALLPESFRFSRALILLGSAWNLIILIGLRLVLGKSGWSSFRMKTNHSKRLVIVAKKNEYNRIKNLLGQIGQKTVVAGRVDPSHQDEISGPEELGKIENLEDIVEINRIDEIVFSGADIPANEIIQYMLALRKSQTDFKISPPDSKSIIGSNSINTAGELYVININSIAEPANKRKKRLFDLLSSLALILTLPLTIWFFLNKAGKYLKNLFAVLLGLRSWVGYYPDSESADQPLPKIKPGVLHPAPNLKPGEEMKAELNLQYARNYRVWFDIRTMFRYLRGFL